MKLATSKAFRGHQGDEWPIKGYQKPYIVPLSYMFTLDLSLNAVATFCIQSGHWSL